MVIWNDLDQYKLDAEKKTASKGLSNLKRPVIQNLHCITAHARETRLKFKQAADLRSGLRFIEEVDFLENNNML